MTCNQKFQESSLLETWFLVFENTVHGEPADLPRFFVPWLSLCVGLGFQNGCSQAEVTKSLSPPCVHLLFISTTSRGWTLMQSYFWPAADYNWRWTQAGTSLRRNLPALVRHSPLIPSLKLRYWQLWSGFTALQHLNSAWPDLLQTAGLLNPKLLWKHQGYVLILPICLLGGPCRNSINYTYLIKVQ